MNCRTDETEIIRTQKLEELVVGKIVLDYDRHLSKCFRKNFGAYFSQR
jgi:hypothetical protein